MGRFDAPVGKDRLLKAAEGLKARGFGANVVKDGKAALAAVKELVPAGSEVFTMASITLEETGIVEALNGSGYSSVRAKLTSMDKPGQEAEKRRLGASPAIAVGSVHALTEGGVALVASLTGSQLPAYAAGAEKVVFVVGAQKVVKDLDEAMERLSSHVVPKESVRARKAYGLPDSFNSSPNKILLLQGEIVPDRVHFVLMEEAKGF